MTAMNPIRTLRNPDQGAAALALMVLAREPFFFVRYGDGALECMAGRQGRTRDGEQYSRELGYALEASWKALMTRPELMVVG